MSRLARRREHVLAQWHDPETVYRRVFADEPSSFWLDSGPATDTGMSRMGRGAERLIGDVATLTVEHHRADGRAELLDGSILDVLRAVRHAAEPAGADDARGHDWVGWFGYEFGAWLVGAPMSRGALPDAVFLRVDDQIVFDHATRTVTLSSADEDWMTTAIERLSASSVATPLAAPTGGVCRPRHSDAEYRRLVEQCQEEIRRGEAYQLCLTNTLRIDGRHDPLDTYLRLRSASPSHHGGLLRFGPISLVSSSPEQFLQVSPDGLVRTKPIKGTRPRGNDALDDGRLRAELLASEKERAENLMIVDLMRNDLSRISQLGSVAVTSLHHVESYPQVHQLVSTVEGRLRSDLDVLDVIASAFPAGSMTGAPKRRAMEILHGLEAGPRGPYAGAFGVIGSDGSLDLAMVIRTIILDPGGATIGTGGGITALSVPDEELEEIWTKAAAPLAALGVGRPAAESR